MACYVNHSACYVNHSPPSAAEPSSCSSRSSCSPATSGSSNPLQSSSSLCKRCWNQCGRCSSRARHRHHLKAVCNVPIVFSEKFTGPCIIPVMCSSDPRILLAQQFAKLSSPSHKASPVSLLVPVQLSLFSILLNGHVFASIQWLFPLEINHRVKSPTPKTQQCMLEAKVEKGILRHTK